MYHDFERHKRGDHAKWVITGIAFVLVFILLAGVLMQLFMPDGKRPADWFTKPDTEQTEEQPATEQGGMEVEPATENGVALAMVSIPRRLFAANGISEQAENATSVTATLYPENVLSRNVVWSLSWENDSDAWVADKRVEEYVTMANPTPLTANVSCIQPFGETILLTCASRFNPEVKATCKLEYIRKVDYVTFSSTVDGTKLMLNSRGDPERVRYRGPMVGSTFLNNGSLTITEANVASVSNYNFTPSYGQVYTKEDPITSYEMEIRLDPTLIANMFEEFSDLLDSSVYNTYIVKSNDANSKFAPFASLFLCSASYEGPLSCFNDITDYVTLNNYMYYWGNGGAHFICEIRATTASGATYSSGDIEVAIDASYLDLGPQSINVSNNVINF